MEFYLQSVLVYRGTKIACGEEISRKTIERVSKGSKTDF